MKLLNTLGDRLLSKFVPRALAHADRYICSWGYWCIGGAVFHGHCCRDDYTGQIKWCDGLVWQGYYC